VKIADGRGCKITDFTDFTDALTRVMTARPLEKASQTACTRACRAQQRKQPLTSEQVRNLENLNV
jgi:hypothetical protein